MEGRGVRSPPAPLQAMAAGVDVLLAWASLHGVLPSDMARVLLFVLAIAGFAIAFAAKSPGLLGLGLLLGFAGLLGFVLALAAARVSASARPDTAMASAADLAALRRKPAPRPVPPRTGGDPDAG